MSVDAKILHQLFQSSNLKDLVRDARALLSNPIILTDLTHQVLEMSDEPDLEDPNWMNIKDSGVIPISQAAANIYRASEMKGIPIFDHEAASGISILRMAISHSHRLVGFMEIPCYFGIPNEAEQEVIIFVADIACLIMMRDLGYINAPNNERDFFISDLLEGRFQDEHAIRERCKKLDWNIYEDFCLITICGHDPQHPLARTLLDTHCQSLVKILDKTTGFVYGDRIKIIAPIHADDVNDGYFFTDLNDYLKKHDLRAGFSRTTNQYAKLSESNIQSNYALDAGMLLKSSELIFFYDKYSIYHLLDVCSQSHDIMSFAHTATFILAEYDRAHNTELMETLYAYLYSGNNVAEAAAKLYIHRNTMNNRLAKINDLIHTDLDDSEVKFHLMLSYHILEFYASTVAKNYESRTDLSPILRHQ